MATKLTPQKILLVDDEPNVLSLLADHLSDATCQCATSQNAFDALYKIRQEPYSLVISDINMPGMSGMELLNVIKRHDPAISVIMITAYRDITMAVDSLRMGACDYITKPFNLHKVRLAVSRALERHRLLVENRHYRLELEKKVRERTLALRNAMNEVEDSYKFTLEALATALDAREHETQAHSQRVREYTLSLASQLGLTGDELINVGRGALLHDVGKIGVRDCILLKPGKLNLEEWVEMKKHPQIGYEILKNIKFLSPAAEIVLSHQERWDGKGYPNQLAETDIPLGARIFAIVDTLDAITANRPYRRGVSFQDALAEIRQCSGTQFDPHVVDAFLSITPETWMALRDSVNRLHQIQESSYDAVCWPRVSPPVSNGRHAQEGPGQRD